MFCMTTLSRMEKDSRMSGHSLKRISLAMVSEKDGKTQNSVALGFIEIATSLLFARSFGSSIRHLDLSTR